MLFTPGIQSPLFVDFVGENDFTHFLLLSGRPTYSVDLEVFRDKLGKNLN